MTTKKQLKTYICDLEAKVEKLKVELMSVRSRHCYEVNYKNDIIERYEASEKELQDQLAAEKEKYATLLEKYIHMMERVVFIQQKGE